MNDIHTVINEMRNRKVNHGKNTSPTLIAWADRLEAAITSIAPCAHVWRTTGGGSGAPRRQVVCEKCSVSRDHMHTQPAAAPGIDLEQFRPAVTAWWSLCLQKRANSVGGPANVQVDAACDLGEAGRLLALIDSSRKGGSTDAKDAARWRKVADLFDSSTSGRNERILEDLGIEFEDVHRPFAHYVDAAMQAASAEVGA